MLDFQNVICDGLSIGVQYLHGRHRGLSIPQSKGLLKAGQLLDGLPHPSGANAERISYFMGGKLQEKLSNKTNPTVLDTAKARIIAKLASLKSVDVMS